METHSKQLAIRTRGNRERKLIPEHSPAHGLTIRRVIAFAEEAAEFEQFYLDRAAALGAHDDPVEEVPVERVIICAWRLRRVYRIENGLFSK